jgi:glycerate-2-kinase
VPFSRSLKRIGRFMHQQKSLKIKLLYHPETSEEVKYRILKAYEILLPKEEITKYLESSKKVNEKSKHCLRNNEKHKLKNKEFISHK